MQSSHYMVLILLQQLKIIFEGVTKDTFVTSLGRWIQHDVRSSWKPVTLGVPQELNTGSHFVQHLYNEQDGEEEGTLSQFANGTQQGGGGGVPEGRLLARGIIWRTGMKETSGSVRGFAKSCPWGATSTSICMELTESSDTVGAL